MMFGVIMTDLANIVAKRDRRIMKLDKRLCMLTYGAAADADMSEQDYSRNERRR